MITQDNLIIPNWNVPSHVKAVITTRKYTHGVSVSPFDKFNIAIHVDDDLNLVQQNREILKQQLNLEYSPFWLNQIHSATAIELSLSNLNKIDQINADASFTNQKNLPSVIMTADCLPLFVSDIYGRAVGAIHAGWRGLLQGVIEETISQMAMKYHIKQEEFLVHLGPAISQKHFEVGQEVKDFFVQKNPIFKNGFISAGILNKHFANIYLLAKLHLNELGISSEQITGGEYCTIENNDLFYSYRKENKTGRMANLIWIEN